MAWCNTTFWWDKTGESENAGKAEMRVDLLTPTNSLVSQSMAHS